MMCVGDRKMVPFVCVRFREAKKKDMCKEIPCNGHGLLAFLLSNIRVDSLTDQAGTISLLNN